MITSIKHHLAHFYFHTHPQKLLEKDLVLIQYVKDSFRSYGLPGDKASGHLFTIPKHKSREDFINLGGLPKCVDGQLTDNGKILALGRATFMGFKNIGAGFREIAIKGVPISGTACLPQSFMQGMKCMSGWVQNFVQYMVLNFLPPHSLEGLASKEALVALSKLAEWHVEVPPSSSTGPIVEDLRMESVIDFILRFAKVIVVVLHKR